MIVGLGNWVHRQRKEYGWRKETKEKGLSDEKVKKLKSIGFQWVTRKRPGKTQEETEEYKRDGVEVDSDAEGEIAEDEEEGDGDAPVAEPPQPRQGIPPTGAAQLTATQGVQYNEGSSTGPGPYFAPWDRYRVQF
jgi:Helicase associated domain